MEKDTKNIDQFRTISLLSVDGNIFFCIVTKRLTDYPLTNSYLSTSVQKGGIPKVPGCIQHTGVVIQLIREAQENKGELVVVWLDLANAYGSIPYKLVKVVLVISHIFQPRTSSWTIIGFHKILYWVHYLRVA